MISQEYTFIEEIDGFEVFRENAAPDSATDTYIAFPVGAQVSQFAGDTLKEVRSWCKENAWDPGPA